MGRTATDKRARLVAAAVQEFHRKGYAGTSIAEVAKSAGVSAGNVFYFFKTKDDLARAVVDEWCHLLAKYLDALAPLAGWRERVDGFIQQAQVISDMYVTIGCPLAGITRDLRIEGDALRAESGRVYRVQFSWLESQFIDGGFSSKQAMAHTRFLMAGYHGAILLAYAQGDPSLIADEVASLKRWLAALPDRPKQPRKTKRKSRGSRPAGSS